MLNVFKPSTTTLKVLLGVTAYEAIAGPVHYTLVHVPYEGESEYRKLQRVARLYASHSRTLTKGLLDQGLLALDDLIAQDYFIEHTEVTPKTEIDRRGLFAAVQQHTVPCFFQFRRKLATLYRADPKSLKLELVLTRKKSRMPELPKMCPTAKNLVDYLEEIEMINFLSLLLYYKRTRELDHYREIYNCDVVPFYSKNHLLKVFELGPEPKFHRRPSVQAAPNWLQSLVKNPRASNNELRRMMFDPPSWWHQWSTEFWPSAEFFDELDEPIKLL
jgi:hypothetical protein